MSPGGIRSLVLRRDAERLFALFSLLLGLSLVLHQLWWDGFEVASPHFVVILAVLWVALRPTSVARFLTMVAAEVVVVALDMPGVGSHTLLVGVCGACVLAYAGWATVRRGALPAGGELFERVAPFLRVSLIVLYVAAAVAKMNSGFFDAAVSCGAALSAQVAWFDPSLLDGSWRLVPAMWGTVLIEALLPLLLAVPRTRVAGLIVGTAFHLVLALAGNVPFTSLALAFYVAFLPADTPGRVLAAFGSPRVVRLRGAAAVGVFAGAVGLWLFGAAAEAADPSLVRTLIGHATRLVVVATVLVAVVIGVRAWRRTSGPVLHAPRSLRLGHPVFVAGIVLLVANALTPYLGLKTETSFAMFSNLQTEAGYWNHAFIPEAVRVFPYQDELVTVTASNDPQLLRRSSQGTRLVRFELERYLRLNPGVWASYREGGAAPVRADASGSPALALVDRVAKFRDVRAPGRRGC